METTNNVTETENIIDKLLEEDKSRYDKINDIISIKKTLKSCIDVKSLVEKMKDLIGKSKDFEFRSKRAEKFINLEDPTFILKCNLLKEFEGITPEKVRKLDPKKIDKLTDKITKLVDKQITSKVSDFLTECVTDKNKYENIFKNLPEEFSDTFLTQIYIIRVSIIDNAVTIKLFN